MTINITVNVTILTCSLRVSYSVIDCKYQRQSRTAAHDAADRDANVRNARGEERRGASTRNFIIFETIKPLLDRRDYRTLPYSPYCSNYRSDNGAGAAAVLVRDCGRHRPETERQTSTGEDDYGRPGEVSTIGFSKKKSITYQSAARG